MANFFNSMPSEDWLKYVKEHVRFVPETGEIFWRIPMKGRQFYRAIGCLDPNGYIKVQVANRACYAHQVVWFLTKGAWPRYLIDHKNRDRSDNREDNLEVSDASKNAMNSGIWASNTTGVKGASITSYGYKVTKQGKHLGYFDTLGEAENAYNK